MILSTKSWHYKLFKRFLQKSEDTPPVNFCAYFWVWVFFVVVLSFAVSIGGWVLTGIGYLAINIGTPFKELDERHRTLSEGGQVGIMLSGIALTIFIGISVLTKESFIKKFIKAILNRYCPKIEWKE